MTFRIDRIERLEHDGHYSWYIEMKGMYGMSVYGRLATGVDGRGLFCATSGPPWTPLVSARRFHAHPGLNAEQVVHRVAALLAYMAWGDELYDDRDSITGGRPVASTTRQSVVPLDPFGSDVA